MMRSLFSGLAGMRTQQQYMDVIGNNIANVNTAGYKAARVNFEDLLYESLRAGSAASNPMQVGGGARVGSIDTIFQQGTPQPTGSQLDLAISGDGFLVVKADERHAYTRSGVLTFNKEGYLIHTATGHRVMGWLADSNGKVHPGRTLQELRAAPGMQAKATASEEVVFEGLFDARLEPGSTIVRDIAVIDPLGRNQILTITFTRVSKDSWSWEIPHPTQTGKGLATGAIAFGTDGRVTTGEKSAPISLDLNDGITPAFQFELDFAACEQGGGEVSVMGVQAGGMPAGTLKEVALDETGRMIGVFSNGVNRVLGQLALATFANPGGLERAPGSLFVETLSSGSANTATAPGHGRGTLTPGYLEMSNVDLTQEFASMILSQRAFQANSRIITAADELLQEVINLRR